MPTYKDRTPESIKAELAQLNEKGVLQLAEFLQAWMANEHNGKNFVEIAKDKASDDPATRARLILGSAYDWFAYGN